jgi:hypothetical protein
MAKNKRITGLGDAVEAVTEATGIKAIVHAIAGDDCGCDERKKKWNELFPFQKRVVNCMSETDKEYLKNFFNSKSDKLGTIQQREMSEIYLRVYNRKIEPTSCGSCWRDYVNELKRAYENS